MFIGLILILLSHATIKAEDRLINMKEVEDFTDEFFKQNMEQYHVPGVAIAFVKDDQVAFMEGYGYADVENKIKVEPQKTVFGIGSISKLLTTTAVMQQVEAGQIDLNKDVNEYLEAFKVKNTFKAPVTMKSLLTHSSGFIQSSIGIGTRNLNEIKELGNYLKTALPKIKYEPRTFFSYSNQGMSLAGYIVECISRIKFEDYMKKNIFEPLQMKDSSFKQPIPENMKSNQAIGYGYEVQKQRLFRTPSMYYHVVPAGGCYTTVEDMSKFIIANLNDGKYKDNQILDKNTMNEMHEQHFTHNEKMPGQAYGFWESFENNKRALFHTGTTDGYASLLYMIPEEKIGFIICYNLPSDKLRSSFLSSFLDTFYPVIEDEIIPDLKEDKESSEKYEGLYWNVEKPRDTIDKIEILMSEGLISVKETDNGSLKLTDYYGKAMGEYREIEPAVFQKVQGEEIITFKTKSAKIDRTYLYFKNEALEKVRWYENRMISIILGIVSLLIVMVSPFIWVTIFIRGKLKKEEKSFLEKYGAYIGLLSSVLIVVFCVIAAMITMKLGKYAFMFGIPLSLKMTLMIPVLLCGISAGLLVTSVLAWKHNYWTRAKRYFFSIYTGSVILFLICLEFWNMI